MHVCACTCVCMHVCVRACMHVDMCAHVEVCGWIVVENFVSGMEISLVDVYFLVVSSGHGCFTLKVLMHISVTFPLPIFLSRVVFASPFLCSSTKLLPLPNPFASIVTFLLPSILNPEEKPRLDD